MAARTAPSDLRVRCEGMMVSWLVGWLGRAVAEANQNEAHGNGCDAEADPYPLQRAEAAPLTSADEIHRDSAEDGEQAWCDDDDTELSLGDHSAYIITQRGEGATLGREVRIGV